MYCILAFALAYIGVADGEICYAPVICYDKKGDDNTDWRMVSPSSECSGANQTELVQKDLDEVYKNYAADIEAAGRNQNSNNLNLALQNFTNTGAGKCFAPVMCTAASDNTTTTNWMQIDLACKDYIEDDDALRRLLQQMVTKVVEVFSSSCTNESTSPGDINAMVQSMRASTQRCVVSVICNEGEKSYGTWKQFHPPENCQTVFKRTTITTVFASGLLQSIEDCKRQRSTRDGK